MEVIGKMHFSAKIVTCTLMALECTLLFNAGNTILGKQPVIEYMRARVRS